MLSHKFGHLFYLYHHWHEYQDFIQSLGDGYEIGGHGANGPSGEAASLAEIGIMRD